MATRDDQSMQRGNGVEVPEGHSEAVLSYEFSAFMFTEGAAFLASINISTDRSEVGVVSRSLVAVALVAKRLEVGPVVASAVPPWNDVIDMQEALVSRDPA